MSAALDSAAALSQTTSLVLLAGGRGSRLGGHDKGLLKVAGSTLIEQLLARFAPLVDEVIIVANRHLERYRLLAEPYSALVVCDLEDGFQGPLMGMLSGLVYASCEQVLVLPCDAYELPLSLLTDLADQQALTASPATFASIEGQDYPVCCLLKRSLCSELEQALLGGSRAPARWLTSIGASRCELGMPEPGCRWSINTPTELAAVQDGRQAGVGYA